MTNAFNLDEEIQAIADWLSSTLKGTSSAVDYEIQDGGKFVLFSAPETTTLVSDKALRNLIYTEVKSRFQGIDAKWMLVFLDAKKDVIDEIDSMIGVDY